MAATSIINGESGSSVRSKLNNILGTLVNVKDHGAIGDGTTDDTAAITAAIAAAPAGSVIYFPTGTYLVTSSIAVTKSLNFKGNGRGTSTVITTSGTINMFTFDGTEATPIEFPSVMDMGFENTFAGSPSAGSAIKFTFCAQFLISNIFVRGFQSNIFLSDSYSWDITNCFFYNYIAAGLNIQNTTASVIDSGDGAITGCSFFPGPKNGAFSYSIYQRNSGGLKISNSKFNGATGQKAAWHYTYSGTGNTVDLLISNCSFENFSQSAIQMSLASGSFRNVTITGNQIDGGVSTAPYIDITGISEINITGNVFYGNTGTTAIALPSCTNVILSNQYTNFTGSTFISGSPTNLMAFSSNGISLIRTITAAGTTGAQTINKPSGTVNFAAGTSSLVVTNNLVTANSIVMCTVRTNDTTAVIKNVVPAAGSFTIRLEANTTAETSVGFLVLN